VSKHNSFGRLGLFLSVLILSNACAEGEIGGFPGDPRLDVGFEEGALICPGVSADVSTSDSWQSKEATHSAPGLLYFEVMARPVEAELDALVAVGAQDIQDFSDAAIAVRFSETGLVDVMDDFEYSSDQSFEYDPGVWYNIAISADVIARTYDVEVGRCGEKRRNIIHGARFRSEANVYDQLNTWGIWSSRLASLELSTPTWMASGTCAPATCETLGAECGQPSDGCNGTLNCGVCGGGQSCSSGVCIDEPVSVPPPLSCMPASCQSLGAECGGPSDGCGGSLNCGGCGDGQFCSNNVCVDQPVTPPPPPPTCVPTTCGALGADCGVRSNGCGGTLNCGGCGDGQFCSDSLCIDQPVTPPPPPACVPDTCQDLGTECGAWSDGCGGTLKCGGCGSTGTCTDGVCVVCTPDCSGKECGGDGCGGSCGSCASPDVCQSNACTTPGEATVFFKDKIQTANEPWGFDEALTEYPVGSFLSAGARSDSKANLSKVADPAGGSGYAIRQAVHANGPGGGRSELGVWTLGGTNASLRSHLRTGAPIFISMEVYLPAHTQPKVPDSTPWLAMYDIHPTAGGVWRPGWSALWPEDGSDRLLVGRKDTDDEKYSSVEMPIGEWFTFEIEWSGGPSQTVRTWINGQLATTQNNVQTTPSGGIISDFETYIKVYTEPQGQPWVADPVIKYVRNYQITDAPRFH
jgi:hypothetical protein